MAFQGVKINRLNGGLQRREAIEDGVCLLVIGGATATGSLAIKTAVELLSIEDAENLGIDASYDDTNSILAHYHIDEFFRISPDGNLFVILDDNTLTIAELKAILKQNASITSVGFVRNAAVAPADLSVYIGQYQTMVNELRAESRLISAVLVEGVEFDPATLISAYADLRTLAAPNVAVVISQDPVIAAIKAEYENHASIGTALGAISVRGVNENIGSVDIENKPDIYKGNQNFTLTDRGRSRWLSANLQSSKSFSSLTPGEIDDLNSKGYIYVGSYNGYPGFYFSDSHTCTLVSSDYNRIENNRVWDKCALLIRNSLLPSVKSNLPKDPDTGFLRVTAAKELEKIASNSMNQMEAAGQISGKDVYIDVTQDLTNDTPLKAKAQVVFNEIVHEIEIDLGLTNKLN